VYPGLAGFNTAIHVVRRLTHEHVPTYAKIGIGERVALPQMRGLPAPIAGTRANSEQGRRRAMATGDGERSLLRGGRPAASRTTCAPRARFGEPLPGPPIPPPPPPPVSLEPQPEAVRPGREPGPRGLRRASASTARPCLAGTPRNRRRREVGTPVGVEEARARGAITTDASGADAATSGVTRRGPQQGDLQHRSGHTRGEGAALAARASVGASTYY